MTAAEAIQAARAAGIRIGVDGDNLMLEADAEPPEQVIVALAKHKAEVIEILRAETQPAPAIDADATAILRRHAKRLGLAPELVTVLAGGHYAQARAPVALPMHVADARARVYAAARLMCLPAWRVQIELPADGADERPTKEALK